MAICTTRKSSQSGDFELLSIPAVQKTEQGFHHNQFPKFSFFQGVFHVLERYIGFEPWDLFPLTIKCYRKCLQNYKGTIFGVAWTEKYRFEIINAVTDEPKGTIFSVISLIISTDQRYWSKRSPFSSWWTGHLRGKLKRPLISSRPLRGPCCSRNCQQQQKRS